VHEADQVANDDFNDVEHGSESDESPEEEENDDSPVDQLSELQGLLKAW
jgi:hypothetical protein